MHLPDIGSLLRKIMNHTEHWMILFLLNGKGVAKERKEKNHRPAQFMTIHSKKI